MNQWDGREKKGGKVKDKTGLFSKSGPKGRRKATRLYHLIQEIATQTFRSIRNQNHSHSDSRRIQEPPALVTPATSSLPPGPLFPAPRLAPSGHRPQLQRDSYRGPRSLSP